MKANILTNWINEAYLQEDTIDMIKQEFNKNSIPSFQLQMFLKEEKYISLLKKLKSIKYELKYIPLESKYEVSNKLIEIKEFTELIHSKEFKDLLFKITGKKLDKHNGEIILLKHTDYILTKDAGNFIYLIFNFTEEWDMNADGYYVFASLDKEPIVISPISNSLSIINAKDCQMYLKYINNLAKNKKINQVIIKF